MENNLKLYIDIFEHDGNLFNYNHVNSVNESSTQLGSLNKVLGVLEDTFFMPNGISRNKRFYSETLWKNCLAKDATKVQLENGSMLGMVEHPLVNQFESQGIPTTAHPMFTGLITKKLEIRTNESTGKLSGYGKAYILDTKMGRLLDSLFSSTDENGQLLVRPAVSSRAFSRSVGKDNMGNDIVDENNYVLQSFDVTFNPGIPQARPNYIPVAKSTMNSVKESVHETTFSMAEELKKDYGLSANVDELKKDIARKLGLDRFL